MIQVARCADLIKLSSDIAGYNFGLDSGYAAHFFKKHGITLANALALVEYINHVLGLPNLLPDHAIGTVAPAFKPFGVLPLEFSSVVILVIVSDIGCYPSENSSCF